MNRIVKTHYPVEKLPEDLRPDLPAGSEVTVTVDPATLEPVHEWEKDVGPPMTIDEIFTAVPEDQRRSGEEIDRDMRRLRDEWGR